MHRRKRRGRVHRAAARWICHRFRLSDSKAAGESKDYKTSLFGMTFSFCFSAMICAGGKRLC